MAIHRRNLRWASGLVPVVGFLCLSGPAHAQTGFAVQGRVVNGENGEGVPNAVVTLDGHRPTLTGSAGDFRFTNVDTGQYELRIEAFGFGSASRFMFVEADVTLTVELDFAPFVLDSLVVSPTAVEVDGHVRDPVRRLSLKDVDIRTSLGDVERTNGRGRFSVRGWEGVSLLLQIRAFGYMPIDTVVTPTVSSRYDFFVEVDPLVQRMIDAEVRRIEERAGGRRAITFRPLDRDALLRYRGRSLMQLLRTQYGHRLRLGCVVVDEKSLTPQMADAILQTTLVQDVERIEFLFRGRMLRVYTREFMRTMLGSGIELQRATYVEMARPPLCT